MRRAPRASAPTAAPRGTRATAGRGGGWAALSLGALGVVFGDIGTSPLYSLQTVFGIDNGAIKATPSDVDGVISMAFWSVLLIVSIKYVVFILRADNDGEGGVMALAALARQRVGSSGRLVAIALLLGVLGASLFFGDSVITPAISVLSAVEGVTVASPGLGEVALPVAAAILAALFLVQRLGTHLVGRFFGPVMVLWFVCIAAAGIPEIVARPAILRALSPTYALLFVADHPYLTFIAMGAVVLAITGAEALYADMGHFGRSPIRRAWFALVFPALVLNYLGQGALILRDPAASANPFYHLVPGWAQLPMVVLATVATVIASQAVISGAFSVTQQAMRLGFLPYLTVRHTSGQHSGQIYVPAANWLMFAGVLLLTLTFRSSARMATAYGLAVTGTFLLTTALFLLVARTRWRWPAWRLVAVGVIFGSIEVTFLAANLTKIIRGGWVPLLIGAAVVTVMTTWQRGRHLVTDRRIAKEGSLAEFVEHLHAHPVRRVPGIAVFLHPTKQTVPLALRANVEFNRALHQRVVIISTVSADAPHVPRGKRLSVDTLGYAHDGIVHITARFGFQDEQNIPLTLRDAFIHVHDLKGDPTDAFYFLSHITIERGDRGGLTTWRKRLFIAMAHNAATPAGYFHLPTDRTVVMGSRVEL